MIPTVWSYSPDAAKTAWRKWHRATRIDTTSEAFLAGAVWALSASGHTALLNEVAALQRRSALWVQALSAAKAWTEELREAWRSGALGSRDGQDALRSNRTVEIDVVLRQAMEQEMQGR